MATSKPKKQPSGDTGILTVRLKKNLSAAALQKRFAEINQQLSALQRQVGFTHIIPVSRQEGDEVVIDIIPAKVPGEATKQTKFASGWGPRKK